MQCLVGDKEAVLINRVEKYCQDHYNIYEQLMNVYISNFTFMSWRQFMQLIMSMTVNLYPYAPELAEASGKPIDDTIKVAEAEFRISK
jgi:hypothetical protein